MTYKALGNKYIPFSSETKRAVKDEFQTGDIIKEVLTCFNECKNQLQDFAPKLRGRNDYETCRNVWTFIKQNIRYEVDPPGVQWVKTPARLWADNVGDCKSFAIFAASCFHNLGIPASFRFVSFSDTNTLPTHVYIVAKPNGLNIPVDAVIEGFNIEKPFKHSIDFDMNTLFRLSGVENSIGYVPEKGVFKIPVMANGTSSDELISAAILKQGLEIEQAMAARVAGIGSPVHSVYDNALNKINKDIASMISGVMPSISSHGYEYVEGIGFFKKIFKGVAKVAKGAVKAVANGAKFVAKTVQKVVTLPFRAIAEVAIPKAAMGFIYCFIKNETLLTKLPAIVVSKREKQLKLASFIYGVIAMKESHFFGIVENGIKKKTGKTPQAYLSEKFGLAISGVQIGLIDDALSVVTTLINTISQLFGKKSDVSAADSAPADSDISKTYASTKEGVEAKDLLQKEGATNSTLEKILNTVQTTAVVVDMAKQTFAASNNMPSVPQTAFIDSNGTQQNAAQATSTSSATDRGTTTEIAPITTIAPPVAAGISSNTMLLIGGGLAAYMLLKKK